MPRNPYVHRFCRGEQVVELMRDVNRVEEALNHISFPLDVMIIIDISGSMQLVIDEVTAQVGRIFTELVGQYGDMRIGVMQQGVDGDTNDPTYARRAKILCQPTRSQSVFSASMNAFPNATGSREWYLNAMELAVYQTQWADNAWKTVITIGDELAYQYRNGEQQEFSYERLNTMIDLFNQQDVRACMICVREENWQYCEPTYELVADGTGDRCLVAPSDTEIVSMLIDMIGFLLYPQTQWSAYTASGTKQSLGVSDGGVEVPAWNAINGLPFVPDYIRDLRNAIESIAMPGWVRDPNGVPYDFSPSGPNNLLECAMGDGSAYGTTPGRRTWRRSIGDMADTLPRDIDLGEAYECLRLLKAALGVTS